MYCPNLNFGSGMYLSLPVNKRLLLITISTLISSGIIKSLEKMEEEGNVSGYEYYVLWN